MDEGVMQAQVQQFVPCHAAERVDNGEWNLQGVGWTTIKVSELPIAVSLPIYICAFTPAPPLTVLRTTLALTSPSGASQQIDGSFLSTAETDAPGLDGLWRELLDEEFVLTEAGLHRLTFAVEGELLAVSRFRVVHEPEAAGTAT